jgi:hypothetical protein
MPAADVAVTPRSHSSPPAPAVRPIDRAARTTVSPVTATLDRDAREANDELSVRHFRRLSIDSKVLVAGGAIAAAMLLVAVGVLYGRSQPGSTARTATTSNVAMSNVANVTGSSPAPTMAASEARPEPATVTASAPPPAVDLLPAAPVLAAAPSARVIEKPAPLVFSLPTEPIATPTSSPSPGSELSVTVDVSQLPAARAASRGRWAAKSPRGAPAPQGQAPANDTGSSSDAPAASARTEDAPPAAPAPTVDPFVQAVREDIREDEGKGGAK